MTLHKTGFVAALALALVGVTFTAPAYANKWGNLVDGAADAAKQGAKAVPDVTVNPRIRPIPDTPRVRPNVGTPDTPNIRPNIGQPNIKAPVTQPNAMGKLPTGPTGRPNVQVTQPNAHGKLPPAYDVVPDRPPVQYEQFPRPLPKTPGADTPPTYSGLGTRNQDQLDNFFEVKRTGINPDGVDFNRNVGRAPAGNDTPGAGRPDFLRNNQPNRNQPGWNGRGNPYGNANANVPARNMRPMADQRVNVPAPATRPSRIKKIAKTGGIAVVGLGAVFGVGYGLTIGIPALVEYIDTSGQVDDSEGVPLTYPDQTQNQNGQQPIN